MKRIVGVLAVAVVAMGIAAVQFWQELGAERSEAGELAARETTLKAAPLAPVAVQLPPAPVAAPVIAAAGPQPAAVPAALTTPPSNPQPPRVAAGSPMQGILESMATPQGQDAMRSMMRSMMAQMYPDIEQELGLTAQEKQKLFDLMADVDADSADLALNIPKDPAARREVQRKMVESERKQEAKLSALLGSKYPKWEEYQSTAQARQQVDQLRRTLSATGDSLSDAQSKQLVAAFAAEQKRTDKETREWSRSSAAIDSPDMMQETVRRAADAQNRLVDVASPILSVAQMERYRRQMEQQQAVLRATMSMMGAGDQP
jgi:hypothetical protein